MAVTPLVRPETSTGVPLPKLQHLTPPALVITQRWKPPTAIAVTPPWRAETSIGVETIRPLTAVGQHLTAPLLVSAQVPEPRAIAVTPLARPETSTGMRLLFVVPFPS